MSITSFVVGMIIGACAGIFLMCLLIVGRSDDVEG